MLFPRNINIMNWFNKISQQPHELTSEQFADYHNTGYIDPESYTHDRYSLESMSHYVKEEYPILIKTMNISGMNVEFRQSGKKQKFVKPDKDGWGMRDENDNVIYLDDQGIEEADLQLHEQTIHVWVDNMHAGWVGDSFGATELFVANELQNRGIGTELLKLYLEMYPTSRNKPRRLGQMTPAGVGLASKVHREMVQDAMDRQESIPEEALQALIKAEYSGEVSAAAKHQVDHVESI